MPANFISSVLKASLEYLARVLMCVLLIGGVRMLILESAIGKSAAMMIEFPIVTVISWRASRNARKKYDIPDAFVAGFFMGVVSFSVLIIFQVIMVVKGDEMTAQQFIAEQFFSKELANRVSLVGQVLFGCFPIIQALISKTERHETISPKQE
jgi:hypothetical protein